MPQKAVNQCCKITHRSIDKDHGAPGVAVLLAQVKKVAIEREKRNITLLSKPYSNLFVLGALLPKVNADLKRLPSPERHSLALRNIFI